MKLTKTIALALTVAGTLACTPVYAEEAEGSGVEVAPARVPELTVVSPHFKETRAVPLPLWVPVPSPIKKGDTIDIIATFPPSAFGTKSEITKTILQGAPVYDVSVPQGPDGMPIGSASITVLLTLQQAEIIAHASNIGTLTYVTYVEGSGITRTATVTNDSIKARYGF